MALLGDRYILDEEIASGGMGSVHLGRLRSDGGFGRTVAIKRLHPQFAKDRSFVAMLVDEARIAGRIHHENVCQVLDVVADGGELFVVMEHIQGVTVSSLLRRGAIPGTIAVRIAVDMLRGLHAAHETGDERGEPLQIVHRDVSPQNVMVAIDGSARVLDFGVAKAAGRLHQTKEGVAKGKVPYMAPEQLRGGAITRRVDVYAASEVLWEMLVGRRMIQGSHPAELAEKVLFGKPRAPSALASGVPEALDAIVLKGLARDPNARWETAKAMADALEGAVAPALRSEVAEWLEATVGPELAERQRRAFELATEVDEERPPPAPRAARGRGLVVALSLVVVAALAVVVARSMRHEPGVSSPGPSATVSAPAPVASTVAVATAPVIESAPAPSVTAKAPSRPARANPCDPPWTFDGEGHKIYKRECL